MKKIIWMPHAKDKLDPVLQGRANPERHAEDRSNFKDYAALTLVVCIGVLLSIYGFVLAAQLQYREAYLQFETSVVNVQSVVNTQVRSIMLQFEALTNLVGDEERQTLASQNQWIRRRVLSTEFSCVVGVQLNRASSHLIRKLTYKDTRHCPSAETATILVKKNASSPVESTASAVKYFTDVYKDQDGTAIVAIVGSISAIPNSFVVATLPLDSLIPLGSVKTLNATIESVVENENEITMAREVTAPGSNSIHSPHYTGLKLKKQISILTMRVNLLFWPATSQFEVRLMWAWTVLGFGLFVTILFGWTVFNLIDKNIQVKKEVATKTKDLQRASEKAIRANQTKSRFLANVSHEVRTPLNLILGMAELLSETQVTKEQKSYIESFRRAGNHLLDVITDILDVSSIEAGELAHQEVEFDILTLIESVSDILAPAFKRKKLEYNYDVDMEVPRRIKSDPKRIRQILINLLNNALKFTDSGYVTLFVGWQASPKQMGQLTFRIQDSGVGIPPEERSKIFDDFYQVDETTKRSASGVGLGLSIVRTFIKHLNGSIHLTSEVGIGSTFHVRIPVEKHSRHGWIEELAGEVHLPQKRSVCLITSNLVLSRYVKKSLERVGFTTTVFDSSVPALQTLDKSRTFQYLIIDLVGTSIHSWTDLLNAARDSASVQKIIAIYPVVHRSDDLEQLTKLGIDEVCYAPVKIKSLVEQICGSEEKDHTSENEGRTVTNLPNAEDNSPRETKPRETAAQDFNKSMRILLAEDDEDNRLLIQAYLSNHNVELWLAKDGQEAVELYKSLYASLDLVITDIQMPKLDGFGVIQAIREEEASAQREPIPIVALTADAQPDQIEKVLSLGGNEYLTKPISKINVLNTIRKYDVNVSVDRNLPSV